MGNTNVNGEHSAPDSGYQRSEAEIEHQRRYEAAEAARGQCTIQIVYLVEERRPDPGPIPRKHAWVMTRQVGEGPVSEGIHHYTCASGLLHCAPKGVEGVRGCDEGA